MADIHSNNRGKSPVLPLSRTVTLTVGADDAVYINNRSSVIVTSDHILKSELISFKECVKKSSFPATSAFWFGLSITLFLPIFTANFNPLFGLSAPEVKATCVIGSIFCILLAIFFFGKWCVFMCRRNMWKDFFTGKDDIIDKCIINIGGQNGDE